MEKQGFEPAHTSRPTRRDFVKAVGTVPAAMTALPQDTSAAEQPKLPQIRIGKHTIPRLICGSNPFGGLSHLSNFINVEMRNYFAPEQIFKTCRRCVEVGIDVFEPLMGRSKLYEQFAAEGIEIRGFVRGQGNPERILALAQTPGVIGIHHYGVATDNWFKAGQLDVVRDYTKRIRDTGLLVGVTSHTAECIAEIESQGWDVDYYMTCMYQWGRTTEELEERAGDRRDLLPIETYTMVTRVEKVAEVFLSGDPIKMTKVIRQVSKPCLAYKILAAGRRCETPETVEAAFKETFENIKPTDAVIVGMYDRYSDQPAENANYVRKYGFLS